MEGQELPCGHGMQSDWPVAFWNVPIAHFLKNAPVIIFWVLARMSTLYVDPKSLRALYHSPLFSKMLVERLHSLPVPSVCIPMPVTRTTAWLLQPLDVAAARALDVSGAISHPDGTESQEY